MVRVGGMTYVCEPGATMGSRISRMNLRGKVIEAEKTYKVAGWAPVTEAARDAGGEPVWDLVARHLRARKTVPAPRVNMPELKGMDGNPGMAS